MRNSSLALIAAAVIAALAVGCGPSEADESRDPAGSSGTVVEEQLPDDTTSAASIIYRLIDKSMPEPGVFAWTQVNGRRRWDAIWESDGGWMGTFYIQDKFLPGAPSTFLTSWLRAYGSKKPLTTWRGRNARKDTREPFDHV
jgi:hypothetical protein